MVTMTVVDVVNITYPGQLNVGNIAFGQDGDSSIFITKWTVPDIPEPSIESLEARIPELQNQFAVTAFITDGQVALMQYMNEVAQQRQYDNAVSCASYVSSTVPQWKAEAETFVSWRDNVMNYAIAQFALMQSGERSVPTFQEFQTELPVISWP